MFPCRDFCEVSDHVNKPLVRFLAQSYHLVAVHSSPLLSFLKNLRHYGSGKSLNESNYLILKHLQAKKSTSKFPHFEILDWCRNLLAAYRYHSDNKLNTYTAEGRGASYDGNPPPPQPDVVIKSPGLCIQLRGGRVIFLENHNSCHLLNIDCTKAFFHDI